jgi:hypothetical protein
MIEKRIKTDREVEIKLLIQLLDSIEYLPQPLLDGGEMGDIITIMQSTYGGLERDAIKKQILKLLKITIDGE